MSSIVLQAECLQVEGWDKESRRLQSQSARTFVHQLAAVQST